jgi:hypothetical protein
MKKKYFGIIFMAVLRNLLIRFNSETRSQHDKNEKIKVKILNIQQNKDRSVKSHLKFMQPCCFVKTQNVYKLKVDGKWTKSKIASQH